MNSRFLFLLIVLVTSILVFFWGTTNYLRCYTDTPSENYAELCPTNTDVHAMPTFIATFVIISVVPILTWMRIKRHRFRVIFTVLSGIGIFFTFVGILNLILMIRV
jgi:hypothetical protein